MVRKIVKLFEYSEMLIDKCFQFMWTDSFNNNCKHIWKLGGAESMVVLHSTRTSSGIWTIQRVADRLQCMGTYRVEVIRVFFMNLIWNYGSNFDMTLVSSPKLRKYKWPIKEASIVTFLGLLYWKVCPHNSRSREES